MNPDTETLYLQQYNALNELKYIINKKINNIKSQENDKLNEIIKERLYASKRLESLRNKIDTAYNNYSSEKEKLNNEIIEINQKLELEDTESEKNEKQEKLKILDEKNIIITNEIKQKLKELQEYEETKTQQYETYQNDLFNIKVNFKGDKMSWNQRFDFLKNRLNSHQNDFSIFNKKWLDYQENYNNKVADIKETISILQEELDDSILNKKIERRDNIKIIRQSLTDKKTYLSEIKKFEEKLSNSEKEKVILIEKQKEWLNVVNNDFSLNMDNIKSSILDIENKININNQEILSVQKNINNVEIDINRGRVDLMNSAWGLRQQLGELKILHEELNKKYQGLLIDLNNQIKTQNKVIEENPFKNELNKMDEIINQCNFGINSLTTRQNSQINKNKFFYEKNKSKLQDIRFNIKNESECIDKLTLEYQNEETKFNEEKDIRKQKINDIENDIKEHYNYLEGLKSQNDLESCKITDEYNLKIREIDSLIKKCQTECNKLKDDSNNIINQKDELNKVKEVLRKKSKYRLEEINKRLYFIDLEMRQLEIMELSYNSEKNKYETFLNDLTKKEEDVKLFFLPQLNELLQSQIRNNNEIENIKKILIIN